MRAVEEAVQRLEEHPVGAVVDVELVDAEPVGRGVRRRGLRLEVGLDVRAPKAVDRLLGVADDDEGVAGRLEEQPLEQAPLRGVGVLELVDQPHAEATPKCAQDGRVVVADRRGEVGQEVGVGADAVASPASLEQLDGAQGGVAVGQRAGVGLGDLARREREVGVVEREPHDAIECLVVERRHVEERRRRVERRGRQHVGDGLAAAFLARSDTAPLVAEPRGGEPVDGADGRRVELRERALRALERAGRVAGRGPARSR